MSAVPRRVGEVLGMVKRWSSLGGEPFEERLGECSWELVMVIPVSAFFQHSVGSLDGKTMRGNFYKCGDKLQTPPFPFLESYPAGTPHVSLSGLFRHLVF